MIIHSAGPWYEKTDDNGDVWVIQDDHKVFIGNMEDTCGACHANATLIVAAPDLLAQCEALVTAWDSGAIMLWDERDIEHFRLAIAKARGI